MGPLAVSARSTSENEVVAELASYRRPQVHDFGCNPEPIILFILSPQRTVSEPRVSCYSRIDFKGQIVAPRTYLFRRVSSERGKYCHYLCFSAVNPPESQDAVASSINSGRYFM